MKIVLLLEVVFGVPLLLFQGTVVVDIVQLLWKFAEMVARS